VITTRNRLQIAIETLAQNTPLFLMLVFLVGLFVRLAMIVATSSYHLGNEIDDHFGFGTEMGRVARSLTEGRGFSSPMPLPTGPTAIVGPVYPLLLALIFKIFGVYTTGSAIAILTLQCIFSSLTCLFIYLCGRDTVGETVGKLAALAWTVFPLTILFAATRIWETSLSGMLAVALFWYMLRLPHSSSVLRWAKTGALLAIAALINTSLVILSIPFLLSAAWKQRVRFVLPAIAAGLSLAVVISPWLIRNHIQFGRFMLRSNFPLEFRVGNNELSSGQKVNELHPARSLEMNQHWQAAGEKRFMAEQNEFNSNYVSAHPRAFAFAILNRMLNYWTGAWIAPTKEYPNNWPSIIGISSLSLLALLGVSRLIAGGNPAGWTYAGCFLLYPLVYYLTTSQPRFYHTISPLLVICGASWLVDVKSKVARLWIATEKATSKTDVSVA
jgi:Dolichyl-phosphate-mannose-protein mannosyltransferase